MLPKDWGRTSNPPGNTSGIMVLVFISDEMEFKKISLKVSFLSELLKAIVFPTSQYLFH